MLIEIWDTFWPLITFCAIVASPLVFLKAAQMSFEKVLQSAFYVAIIAGIYQFLTNGVNLTFVEVK